MHKRGYAYMYTKWAISKVNLICSQQILVSIACYKLTEQVTPSTTC